MRSAPSRTCNSPPTAKSTWPGPRRPRRRHRVRVLDRSPPPAATAGPENEWQDALEELLPADLAAERAIAIATTRSTAVDRRITARSHHPDIEQLLTRPERPADAVADNCLMTVRTRGHRCRDVNQRPSHRRTRLPGRCTSDRNCVAFLLCAGTYTGELDSGFKHRGRGGQVHAGPGWTLLVGGVQPRCGVAVIGSGSVWAAGPFWAFGSADQRLIAQGLDPRGALPVRLRCARPTLRRIRGLGVRGPGTR